MWGTWVLLFTVLPAFENCYINFVYSRIDFAVSRRGCVCITGRLLLSVDDNYEAETSTKSPPYCLRAVSS